MNKRECPAGRKWDNLLNECVIDQTEPEPTTESPPAIVVQLRSTSSTVQANSVVLLSPALWIFVVLATLGSIVALTLWFIIYRRQTSISRTPELQQEPLQKTEPPAINHSLPSERDSHAEMLKRAALSPCSQLQLGAQTSPQLEEGFNAYRDPSKDAERGEGRGLPTCNAMSEHRIPLPATELGGTALVTTKTM